MLRFNKKHIQIYEVWNNTKRLGYSRINNAMICERCYNIHSSYWIAMYHRWIVYNIHFCFHLFISNCEMSHDLYIYTIRVFVHYCYYLIYYIFGSQLYIRIINSLIVTGTLTYVKNIDTLLSKISVQCGIQYRTFIRVSSIRWSAALVVSNEQLCSEHKSAVNLCRISTWSEHGDGTERVVSSTHPAGRTNH